MMKRTLSILFFSLAAVYGADKPTVAQLYDNQLKGVESEFVPLLEAMPAAKFGFAPSGGEFKNVRTFAQQAKHVAAVLYIVSAAAREEKPPVDLTGENGPDSVASKEQVIQFVKDAFAYSHKVMGTLTAANQVDSVKSPFGSGQTVRGEMAALAVSHTFDHYGQMVVYARMNSIVPPASR
jgi:hypothetical protein